MLNTVALMGRIGQELTVKTTLGGSEVVTFSLAVQRNYNKDITDWINVVAWRGTATFIAQYFKKGDLICVEGSIQTRNYDDKDGKKVYVTEVVADQVHFCGEKNSASESATPKAPAQPKADFEEVPETDDDLPF